MVGWGSATVAGASYPRLILDGSLTFSAPAVVAPSTEGSFTVTRSFTFGGTLAGRLVIDTPDAEFQRILTGQGSVTAAFLRNPNPGGPALFWFDDVRYDFSPAAPIPEPATLALLSAGLMGICLRRRLRRR